MNVHAGQDFWRFFLSGICAISSSVIVSLLQESRGLDYSMSGTLLWGATMAARFVLAFVLPPKNTQWTILAMTAGCTVFYIGLVLTRSQASALLLLLGFSLSIAGLNPMIVACAGKMTTAASMGIMLPTAGLGAILMPWAIGLAAQSAGLRAGMAENILPCVGMLVLAGILYMTKRVK